MVTRALFAQALPWLLLAMVLAVPVAYVVGRVDGAADEAAERDAAAARAYVTAVENVTAVGTAIAEIGRNLVNALQASAEAETNDVRIVREVIRENPEFGAVRRPAALERVRRQQLEDVAAATEADRL